MSRIISIHSFRGGTGKSNTAGNVAALLAAEGRRVGVIDTDIQSPGIHVLFGLNEQGVHHTLNDYLWGKCSITDAAHDMTAKLGFEGSGTLFLVPSSIKAGDIARVLREGYDVGVLNDGFRALISVLNLDVLLIDTHPGLNEETLLSIAVSDALAVVMRPDSQDYQGTGVTVEVARKLGVPRMLLVVNKIPHVYDTTSVQERVQQAYNVEVGALVPHSDEVMALASAGIFVLRHGKHEVSNQYRQLATKLMA
jgi:septum site-determining protein MinD